MKSTRPLWGPCCYYQLRFSGRYWSTQTWKAGKSNFKNSDTFVFYTAYLIPRTKECALMTSPWQLRVTSASSLLVRNSASWAIKWVLSKLMLCVCRASEMLCQHEQEQEHLGDTKIRAWSIDQITSLTKLEFSWHWLYHCHVFFFKLWSYINRHQRLSFKIVSASLILSTRFSSMLL